MKILTSLFLILFFAPLIHSQDAPEDILDKAHSEFRNKNFVEAIVLYNEYLDNSGIDTSGVYLWRGNCYSRIGNFEKALEDFDKYIGNYPVDPIGYFERGYLYHGNDKFPNRGSLCFSHLIKIAIPFNPSEKI